MNRREFLKISTVCVLSASTSRSAEARPNKERSPDAIGILYDATLCIGCKACEVQCKKVNNKKTSHSQIENQYGVPGIWDSAADLDTNTLNKIKLYSHGNGLNKDSEINGYSFIKRACMHCVDADCVSVCPVSALKKDPGTGIVRYNPDACCGCRYCQIACQYVVPKFEYHKTFPKLVKCEMCSHLIADGGIPGCCDACPTGASIFGKVTDLLEEAKKRIQQTPGTFYDFPISTIDSKSKSTRPVKEYVPHIYGEKEGGGTQYIMLSSVPFEKLGLPLLPEQSNASRSETLQHTIYKGLAAPFLLLTGFFVAAYRATQKHKKEILEEDE